MAAISQGKNQAPEATMAEGASPDRDIEANVMFLGHQQTDHSEIEMWIFNDNEKKGTKVPKTANLVKNVTNMIFIQISGAS